MVGTENESGGSSIDPFIDAYEEAQTRDGHAEPADYLPAPDHPLYEAVLCELIRVDLEYGWMRGRPRRLEDYREEFPALFHSPESLHQVAFEEWRLRRQAGEEASPDDYLRRFGVVIPDGASPRRCIPGKEAGATPDGVLRGSRGTSPRPDRRHQRGHPTRPTPPSAAHPDSLEHTELFQSLRDSDPEAADRVARALAAMPEAGAVFAGFRLIGELGRGTFSRVYLARQGDLADRLVALKVAPELSDELRALAQLQHTAIVPIYSAHRVGPLRAVCMPYLGSTTLADVLADLKLREDLPDSGAAFVEVLGSRRCDPDPTATPRPTPTTAALQTLRRLDRVRAVLWIGTQLAEGLAHAHERGIIHRDLKPANILLTDDGQPMLLDFNLAADTKLSDHAAAALVGGTLPYMAPEALVALRLGPRAADARGDLYALGLILWELLTGRHPFPIHRGPADETLMRMIADRSGPPPRVRPRDPAVSPAVESLLRRCLEPDPARRYQEARHLLEDLQRQLADRALRHAPEPSLSERARKWTRRHPRLGSAAVFGALSALLIAGVFALYTHRQRQFGPVEAAHALRQFADEHEAARILLLDPAVDPARREEGIATCRRALARYGALESPSWRDSALVRDLPAPGQAELRAHLGEMLMLWAGALARKASGLDPAHCDDAIRTARRLNALAESCYGPGVAPRVLWAQRAALARRAGDDGEMRRARERAAATPIRSLREYVLLALDDSDRAPPAGALPALAEASLRSPQDFTLWMLLGQCYALRSHPGEAVDCFTIAITLRPRSPWPYVHRGLIELERREYEQARLDFDQALRLRPDLASAYVNRALARMGQGDDVGAVADLTAALDREAAETRIYLIRARARDRMGDRAGAERDRAEGLRRTPGDEESWIARGLARLPDDPEGALADFDAALTLNPRSRSGLQDKAYVLSEYLDRTEEAIRVLDRAVLLHPDYVPARIGRGVLLARQGRRAAAHRDAEESRRRDTSGETTYRIACIYALTSRTEPSDRALALGMLATALGQEATWARIARTDPDLDALRDLSEFRDLLRSFADDPPRPGRSEVRTPL